MKRKKIILIVFIISALLIVSGISYSLLIENNNSKIKENENKDKHNKKEKQKAEKIILDSSETIKKDNLKFVSSDKNIYTYSYKVDDSDAIVNYEVDIEKGTYTLVVGQLTKSE